MRMSARLRALRRREDGFTLPELVITVTIIGIIAAGLTGVVISFLTTTTATQSRLTESLTIVVRRACDGGTSCD